MSTTNGCATVQNRSRAWHHRRRDPDTGLRFYRFEPTDQPPLTEISNAVDEEEASDGLLVLTALDDRVDDEADVDLEQLALVDETARVECTECGIDYDRTGFCPQCGRNNPAMHFCKPRIRVSRRPRSFVVQER